ncbi:MAG: RlmE family RNA methyltransferase [Burkholderiales bacterium]
MARQGGRMVRGGVRWMDEHVNDPFVRRARAEGFRSRAAYKLIELDQRDRLFAPKQLVIDLGAAPGSWSQVAAARVGAQGRIIAVDLLPVQPMPAVTVIEGDFTTDAVLEAITSALGGERVDVVLSDMSPNLSGIAIADQARATLLAELALDFAITHLKPNGAFVVKAFQGVGFPALLASMRSRFGSVASRKPEASRDRSAEMYMVARGYRPSDRT